MSGYQLLWLSHLDNGRNFRIRKRLRSQDDARIGNHSKSTIQGRRQRVGDMPGGGGSKISYQLRHLIQAKFRKLFEFRQI
jgi:hypothetical protein